MASKNTFCKEMLQNLYEKVKIKYGLDVDLKPEQEDALVSLLNQNDCLCVLPTGYGKSLIYTVLPLLWDEVETTVKHSALVCSPLKSLMTDQCERMEKMGISVAVYTSETTDVVREDVKKGKFNIILASPESLVKYADDLADDTYPGKVVAFVIDEAHLVIDWDSFRPKYKNLKEAKAIISSRYPWALFTATCDKELKTALVKALGPRNIHIVAISPNRANIFLDYHQKKGMSVEESFSGLVTQLLEFEEKTPKTLIYCRTKEATGAIYAYIVNKLRHKAFAHGDMSKRFIEQYSASYTGSDEDRIIKRIVENDASLRVVVTTVALGMGIDMRDIEVVYHWGVSSTVLQYWQEVGRAGRGGKASKAILLAYPLSVPASSDSMKKLIKKINEGNCIRKCILDELKLNDTDVTDEEKAATLRCCSVCDVKTK